jgi:hypothetical protein
MKVTYYSNLVVRERVFSTSIGMVGSSLEADIKRPNTGPIEINWPYSGRISIREAEEFIKILQKTVEIAKQYNKEMNIKEE